jgi:spore germination protein
MIEEEMTVQIHVVQPNQTLTQIAQRYSIAPEEITRANELPNPNQLAQGQALVIPITGQFYFVRRGDSLWSIAQRFNISYMELARINNLSPTYPLSIDQRLYIPPQPKRRAEFIAYIEPFGNEVSAALTNSARKAAPYLTYLSPVSFEVKRDGTLEEPPLGNLAEIAEENDNIFMMVITNQENGEFSDELGRILLNDPAIQNKLLGNIISAARKYGFEDIHFDFEFLRPEDREAYVQFLRKAKERTQKEGWLLSIALAPKTSAEQKGKWYEAHDYKALGEIADMALIMTYEWGYSGGPPMPVSPIGPVRDVLEYALTEIPASKIMMGQNLYGYDWTLPYTPGSTAKGISPQRAIQLAIQYNVPIKYDQKQQAPFIDYTDEAGKQHKVWFEDARSIQAKFNLLKELNLRGVGYWKLGLPFPQNWLLIADNFIPVKK